MTWPYLKHLKCYDLNGLEHWTYCTVLIATKDQLVSSIWFYHDLNLERIHRPKQCVWYLGTYSTECP